MFETNLDSIWSKLLERDKRLCCKVRAGSFKKGLHGATISGIAACDDLADGSGLARRRGSIGVRMALTVRAHQGRDRHRLSVQCSHRRITLKLRNTSQYERCDRSEAAESSKATFASSKTVVLRSNMVDALQ